MAKNYMQASRDNIKKEKPKNEMAGKFFARQTTTIKISRKFKAA
jgi:hypothetical protein